MSRVGPVWMQALGLAAGLLLGMAAARASEATQLADRAGFLVGHAHRCGVAEAHLERTQGRIDELIAAFSVDDGDNEDAQTQFAQRVLASALAQMIGDPLPACGVVRSQLARFEQHRRPAIAQPDSFKERRLVEQNRPDSGPGRDAASTKPAKSGKSLTRREELTPERRSVLELRRAAHRLRGRPPSI